MNTIIDEPIAAPASERELSHARLAAAGAPPSGRAMIPDAGANRGTDALPLDQNLPRLLYELAVRLPMQPDIQARCVWLYEPAGQAIRLHVLMAGPPNRSGAGPGFPVADAIAAWVWQRQQPLMINPEEETRFPEFARALLEAGSKSFCGIPLIIDSRRIGVLGLASGKPDAFRNFQLQFVQRGAPVPAEAPVDALDDLAGPAQPEVQFEGIIGRSALLQAVLEQVAIVAPTNASVLVLGETGTGKELIAQAIHNRSSRRGRAFVRINCAAIPAGLLESELFGHERGAFTGAITRKIGRFELANGGTLFLDEIGDLPLDLQTKLLRVLQEQEFERVGGSQTIRVDVRMVAATSRNLPQMMASGEFRSDLYYRLNVFPLRLPALRERPEDIPLLVHHFMKLSARRMNKPVTCVSEESMQGLRACPWPGNVRELQNFVERAVILSPGNVLLPPLAELKPAPACPVASGLTAASLPATLKTAEREHILQALAETNWVVGGPKGAAARLGLQRTTLISKMQKLGITRMEA